MKIIDLHVHTSTRAMSGLHTVDASIGALENIADEYGITKIVLMATYFPFKGTGLTNSKLLDRVKDNPLFSVFGSLEAGHHFDEGLAELTQLAQEEQIVGIKLYPGYQEFSPSDPKMFPLYQMALDHNLPVMFHGGDTHGCCPKDEEGERILQCYQDHCQLNDFRYCTHPNAFRGLLSSFPDLKVVVSHLANPNFRSLQYLMNEYENVFTDISGLFVSGSAKVTLKDKKFFSKKILNFLKRVKNGADRIAFATDFPIQSYQDTFDLLDYLDLSTDVLDKVLSKNAKKILNKSWRL